MRYYKYLTEDVVSQALDLDEPKVGGKYPSEKIKRYLNIINKALQAMSSREESEANDNVVEDLRDKKKKWSNVNKETEPTKTKLELPPDQQDEEPPEEDGAPPPEKDDETPPKKKKKPVEQQKESNLSKYFNLKEDLETQKYFEKLLKDLKAGKITKEEMYKKMLHTSKP